jgi:hypothetical protein
MPNWSPETVNSFFLACFFIFVCGCLVAIWRFMAPLIRDNFKAKQKVHECQASLATSLETTTVQNTALMERQTAMLNDHGIKLDQHGDLLEEHGDALHAIARKIGAEVRLQRHKGTVRMTPALEVSAGGPGEHSTVRSVVVVEESGTNPPPTKHGG